MNLIELTAENIEQHLNGCADVQQYLIAPSETVNREQIKATAIAPHSYFAALVEDGRVIGLGVVNKIVHPVRTDGYIDNIVIHPDYRGRGLFTLLMDVLEAKAKEWGAAQTKLTCSRPAAQPLYEKRGYAEKIDSKYYVKQL